MEGHLVSLSIKQAKQTNKQKVVSLDTDTLFLKRVQIINSVVVDETMFCLIRWVQTKMVGLKLLL